jgi:4-amino-4-deoxy-L-arabinose transferase-like glycosyltransferase
VALLAGVLALGFAWALFLPGGQAPDEPSHIAYVQVLAERLDLPEPDEPSDRERGYSTEQRLARERSHQFWQHFDPAVKTVWDPQAERRWLAEQARLGPTARSDGGGPGSAAGNPPLYYAYEALAYRAAAGGTFFDRLYAMRMWSALLLAAGVVATWLLAGELTGGNRLAQLVAAACVGLQPMASFISASINPDAGLIPLWALTFWLGVRVLRRRATPTVVVAMLAATTAAIMTKASSLALLPAVAFVMAVAARRAVREGVLPARRLVVIAAAAVVVLGLAAGAASAKYGGALSFQPGDLRGFGSYMWQAYLPNLPFQTPVKNLAAFWGYEIWIRTGWAAFGWLEIQFPGLVYHLLAAISVVVVLAGGAAVLRRSFPLEGATIAFFSIAAVVLVLGLHWAEYRHFVTQHQPFIQGRYLFPLLPLGGILTAAALSQLPPRWRGIGAAAVLGGLFALQLFSLGLVAVRFYV